MFWHNFFGLEIFFPKILEVVQGIGKKDWSFNSGLFSEGCWDISTRSIIPGPGTSIN
jgi:hypothetical protein